MTTMTDSRTHPNSYNRWVAALADWYAGRDIEWVRKDPHETIRLVAAWADYNARRNLAWARQDPNPDVRLVGGQNEDD